MLWSKNSTKSKQDSYHSKGSRRQQRKMIIIVMVVILGILLVALAVWLAQMILTPGSTPGLFGTSPG